MATFITWLKMAFVALVIAIILFVIAFATSAWVSIEDRRQYQSIGLWKHKFCDQSRCSEGRFGFRLHYDFHTATQALETIGLICLIVAFILLILYMAVDSCRRRNALIATVIFIFVSVFFIVVGIAVCGSKYSDYGYSIAWSMGLAIAASIFDFIAGILCVLQIVGK